MKFTTKVTPSSSSIASFYFCSEETDSGKAKRHTLHDNKCNKYCFH